ncbi:MAG: type IV toxin-antitoxin system AbiEi family antitoxin domain-containing protein [Nitrosotalea sp.]
MLLEDIMVAQKLRLGPTELKLWLTLEKEGKSVFKTDDAYRILGTSKDSVNTALYRLRNKGRIREIERGKYLLIPAKSGIEGKWAETPFLIASELVHPHYIGFWSALNYWGMTEQVPDITYVVTTKRRKKKELTYGPINFEFITLSKKKFFGIVEEKIEDGAFNISSREKTVVDCLLYPQYSGGIDETIKGIWESQDELDFEKILDYSKKIDVDVVTRRIGYILDMLGIKSDITEKIAKEKPKGFMWLDPIGPKKVLDYAKKYGLIINRTKKDLTSWMGY